MREWPAATLQAATCYPTGLQTTGLCANELVSNSHSQQAGHSRSLPFSETDRQTDRPTHTHTHTQPGNVSTNFGIINNCHHKIHGRKRGRRARGARRARLCPREPLCRDRMADLRNRLKVSLNGGDFSASAGRLARLPLCGMHRNRLCGKWDRTARQGRAGRET